jgi:hypothetical protein
MRLRRSCSRAESGCSLWACGVEKALFSHLLPPRDALLEGDTAGEVRDSICNGGYQGRGKCVGGKKVRASYQWVTSSERRSVNLSGRRSSASLEVLRRPSQASSTPQGARFWHKPIDPSFGSRTATALPENQTGRCQNVQTDRGRLEISPGGRNEKWRVPGNRQWQQ